MDAELLEAVFDTMLEQLHGDADTIPDDQRFATAIDHIAATDALMLLVAFADSERPAGGLQVPQPVKREPSKHSNRVINSVSS
ncbi:hypothetical protein [Microvirga soli]|uniref:hypothetical protein n=1 Tax=Microvirga soli TaxID=1854496 RepID=UPI00191DE9DA|nr:hypothetical protein [Microvirga soli]